MQPAPQPQPKPAPRRRRKPPKPRGPQRLGFFKDKREDATATFWPISNTLTSQDTRILSGSHRQEEHMHHGIKKSVINFQEALRSWTETGNNIETPGKKERPTHPYRITVSLAQCVLLLCRAILAEFRDEYLHCPDLRSGKGWRRSSEPDGMSPTLLGP